MGGPNLETGDDVQLIGDVENWLQLFNSVSLPQVKLGSFRLSRPIGQLLFYPSFDFGQRGSQRIRPAGLPVQKTSSITWIIPVLSELDSQSEQSEILDQGGRESR